MKYIFPFLLLGFFFYTSFLYSQDDSINIHGNTIKQDSIRKKLHIGFGMGIAGGMGEFGYRFIFTDGGKWLFTAGFGSWSHRTEYISGVSQSPYPYYRLTETSEKSLLISGRYYWDKQFYLMSGINVKLRRQLFDIETLSKSVTVGTIGIPFVVGTETVIEREMGLVAHIEAGYCYYVGPGSKSRNIMMRYNSITDRTTLDAVTGAWGGVGITYYFN